MAEARRSGAQGTTLKNRIRPAKGQHLEPLGPEDQKRASGGYPRRRLDQIAEKLNVLGGRGRYGQKTTRADGHEPGGSR
jgi:hypothetical protein